MRAFSKLYWCGKHKCMLFLSLSISANLMCSVCRWDAIIAVCLSSAFHSTKAALPFMLEQKWGRIINTGSMHALVASPYKSAYNAAKHGIAGQCICHS